MDRRQLLRMIAFAGGAAGLAACSSGGSNPLAAATIPSTTSFPPTAALPTTTAAPPATLAPLDPDLAWWLQGGFKPVADELDLVDLEVVGSLPPSLDGLYVRNGSNGLDPSGHWFFGPGMAHGIRFEGGKASWYRNRFIQTGASTGPEGGPPSGAGGISNVSFFTHAGRLFSSGEGSWPVELDPNDLSSHGQDGWGGGLNSSFTAHPKLDPRTGLLHAFGYGFFDPLLSYYVISADGSEVIHKTSVPVSGPTMMHDFAITETHAVFWEGPVVFSLEAAIGGKPAPFQWEPSYGSRIGILPLGADGSETRWVEIDNGFVFHASNAWNDGDDIVLDVSRFESAFGDDPIQDSFLHRWTVNTAGADLTWSDETLVPDISLDFPMIDRRTLGQAHTKAWYTFTEGSIDLDGPFYPGMTGFDAVTGELDRWDSGVGLQPGEPLFVPDSDSAAEGEGWLLTFAYEQATDTSRLLVLDATDVAAGPVAEVRLPVRVPIGFHATWMQA